jgi:hypothetical protein
VLLASLINKKILKVAIIKIRERSEMLTRNVKEQEPITEPTELLALTKLMKLANLLVECYLMKATTWKRKQ